MSKVTPAVAQRLEISRQQLERAAEIISKLVRPPDPCAGYNFVGLLAAYLGDADARVKMNAVIAAAERRQSPAE